MPQQSRFKISELMLKAPEKPTLSSPARRRKLLLWVAAFHAAILLIPLAVWSIGDWLFSKPKKEFITVTISGSSQPKKRGSSRRAPKLRPPKSQPKPRLKPKPAPKQETKVQPKPAAKTKPVPAKTSTRTTKTASRKTPAPAQKDPWEDLRPAAQTPPPSPAQEKEEQDTGDSGEEVSYDESLVGTLYELWKPPSDALLAGRRPVVLTRITVTPAGRVLKAEILRRSGFAPMDESVQKLLSSLSELPQPPKDHLVFEVEFTPYE